MCSNLVVVVTGRLGHRGTDGEKVLKGWSEFASLLPEAQVRIVTGTSIGDGIRQDFPNLTFIPSAEISVEYKKALAPIEQSVTRQRQDVLTALEGTNPSDLVLRVRTDFELIDPLVLLETIRKLRRQLLAAKSLGIMAEGSRNFLLLPTPHDFSDFVQLGRSEHVRSFWDCHADYPNSSLINASSVKGGKSFTPNLAWSWTPEQFAFRNFLGSGFEGSHREPAYRDFLECERAVGRSLYILSSHDLGLRLPESLIPPGTLFARFNLSKTELQKRRFPRLRAMIGFMHARLLFWLNPIWWGMRRALT